MRVLTHFTGTVRDFRRWLRQQKCQVYHLAGYREKKKPARKRAERKAIITTSSIPVKEAGATNIRYHWGVMD